MSDLRVLYHDLILDHSQSPHGLGVIENPTHQSLGYNPLCGDKISLTMTLLEDQIKAIKFEGQACAICTASTSLMIQALEYKTTENAKYMFKQMQSMLVEGACPPVLGKLQALQGVKNYPARVKCAMLPWHTMMGALEKQSDISCE